MKFTYSIPTKILFGPGSFNDLATTPLPGKKALVVITAGKSMRANGYLDRLIDMLDKQGNVPNMERAMLADAIATTTGAVCGTSTVTTFVESSAGIAEGGRTGLTSLVAAALFFIAMFLSPIAALVPSCATAAALIYVGVLMMHCVREIEWTDAATAVPAFLTIAMMPFAYNISYGISFGIFSYLLISLFTGKAKQIKAGTWVIGILFAVMFLLTH